MNPIFKIAFTASVLLITANIGGLVMLNSDFWQKVADFTTLVAISIFAICFLILIWS